MGGRRISPRLFPLVLVHGALMSAWVILFLVQSLLISARRRRLHMKLGWGAVVVALGVTITGLMVAVQSVRPVPDVPFWGMAYRQFLLVMLAEVTLFAAFVLAGVSFRKRPAIHRPMMLLASLEHSRWRHGADADTLPGLWRGRTDGNLWPHLHSGGTIPLGGLPADEGYRWMACRRLRHHGCVLFRGFGVRRERALEPLGQRFLQHLDPLAEGPQRAARRGAAHDPRGLDQTSHMGSDDSPVRNRPDRLWLRCRWTRQSLPQHDLLAARGCDDQRRRIRRAHVPRW